ncbi:MAG: methyltransferase domain-containing protein [Gemmatimonadota bacterium]|nr:methyltransferase domain-containing protein [Gemmatimonadota bacterium]
MQFLAATSLAALLLLSSACTRTADARLSTARPVDTLNFSAPDRPVSSIIVPRWSSEDLRDRNGEAARVIALAGVQPGMTVADIGAGDGYYVARLSPIVGPNGKVIGEDIMPAYTDMLRARAKKENLQNVIVLLGTADNPTLSPQSIDAAFMIHMYHEITRPFELLWHLSRAMKPSATLVIVDQDGPTDRHGTPPALLRCEVGILGYEQTQTTVLEDGAYVALFRAPKQPVAPAVVRRQLSSRACNQVH